MIAAEMLVVCGDHTGEIQLEPLGESLVCTIMSGYVWHSKPTVSSDVNGTLLAAHVVCTTRTRSV